MTDHKFTDDENILLLLKWSDDLYANVKLTPEEAKTLFDLINRQKAEIEALTSAVDNSTKEFLKLHDEYQAQKAEIKRLNTLAELGNMRANDYRAMRDKAKTARSEAIKEFAERLIDKCTDPHWCVWMSEIEDLVKEMTEGEK